MSIRSYNPTDRFLDQVEHQLGMLIEEPEEAIKKPNCFLSSEQISEHYNNHYKGYLEGYKQAKKLLKSVSVSDKIEYRSVLLDLSFNYNGIVLHENYFESLGKSEPTKAGKKAIDSAFNDINKLKEALVGAVKAAQGWAILGYNYVDKKLDLTIVDHHDVHGAFFMPVLALDAWEHAYYMDYKSDKDGYAKAMVEDINWDVVSRRIDRAK